MVCVSIALIPSRPLPQLVALMYYFGGPTVLTSRDFLILNNTNKLGQLFFVDQCYIAFCTVGHPVRR